MDARQFGGNPGGKMSEARETASAAAASAETEATAVTRSSGGSSVRWSGGAVLGRQLSQIICALVLARILGPDTYGLISAATVYVTFTTLLLDQGLAAALVQKPVLGRYTAGMVATANLACGLLFGLMTLVTAPLIAQFFHAPALADLLRVLGGGLIIKAAAITPRAMNLRRLSFRVIGLADIAGGVSGAALGIGAALLGAGIWSMAVQVLVTDAVIATWLLVRTRGTAPNWRFSELRSVLPFSLRIFGSNGLAFMSRNLDNILVGRFLGVLSLSLYSMAYRVLVIPVQMIGQTVNRVTFPMFSRLAGEPDRLRRAVIMVTEVLAFATVPVMALVAVGAPELIEAVLGPRWSATAPLLTILSVAGARETVLSITQSLMRARGAGRLILRYEVLATSVQISGIVIGLQFGLVGVAVGLTLAGFALTPVLLLIQRRLCGVRIRVQLQGIAAPVHASLWGAGAYLLVRQFVGGTWSTLMLGGIAYGVAAFGILFTIHRPALKRAAAAGREVARGR